MGSRPMARRMASSTTDQARDVSIVTRIEIRAIGTAMRTVIE